MSKRKKYSSKIKRSRWLQKNDKKCQYGFGAERTINNKP